MAIRSYTQGGGIAGAASQTPPARSLPTPPQPSSSPSNTLPDKKVEDERSKKINSQNAPVVFPSDLGSNYYISFNAFKHEIEKPVDVRRSFNFQKSINLPLPSNLSDSYSADYNSENLYFAGNAIRQGLTELSSGTGGVIGGLSNIDANSVGKGAASALNYLTNNKGNLAAATAALALQGTSGPIGSAAKSAFQVAANPFPVMIFQGTKLKPPFTFDWTLYPESYEEAKTIKTIIGFFRREMLPETFPGNAAILKTPSIFEIVLYPKSPTLRKFKRCVLTNMMVNYSPNGLSFVTDGKSKEDPSPVSTSLSLTFQEIEVWLADDYETSESSSFAPKEDSFTPPYEDASTTLA
jgi:hypothetical protein